MTRAKRTETANFLLDLITPAEELMIGSAEELMIGSNEVTGDLSEMSELLKDSNGKFHALLTDSEESFTDKLRKLPSKVDDLLGSTVPNKNKQ